MWELVERREVQERPEAEGEWDVKSGRCGGRRAALQGMSCTQGCGGNRLEKGEDLGWRRKEGSSSRGSGICTVISF